MTRIQINSKINGQFHLRVVDLLGQTVQQLPVNLSTGENTLDFDASALHTGMYLLQVQNESGLISQKLLVQH